MKSFLSNVFTSATAALGTLTAALESSGGLAPTVAVPCANNAIWQEAITNDLAAGNGSNTNRLFYSTVADMQRLENSSQSYASDPLVSSSTFSETLQSGLQVYPTDFNQAQALETQGNS